MPDNTDLVKIIRDLIRQELSKSKRITTNDIRSIGGTLYLNSAEDIRIQTAGTHKVYINGIGFGVGDNGELLIYTKGGIREVPI